MHKKSNAILFSIILNIKGVFLSKNFWKNHTRRYICRQFLMEHKKTNHIKLIIKCLEYQTRQFG